MCARLHPVRNETIKIKRKQNDRGDELTVERFRKREDICKRRRKKTQKAVEARKIFLFGARETSPFARDREKKHVDADSARGVRRACVTEA